MARAREKGRDPGKGGEHDGVETGGRGGRAARSAHRAKCSAAKAPALTLLRTPCASGPEGPSVRRRKQGTDRGPETICVHHLYNAVSFILPRLVICPANERVLREYAIVPIYKNEPNNFYLHFLSRAFILEYFKIFIELQIYLQRIVCICTNMHAHVRHMSFLTKTDENKNRYRLL